MIGKEADRVAVRAAAEAVIEALVVVDGEARRLLVVERAASLPLTPGAKQLHRRGDDGGEDRARAKLVQKGGRKAHREENFVTADSQARKAARRLIHRCRRGETKLSLCEELTHEPAA